MEHSSLGAHPNSSGLSQGSSHIRPNLSFQTLLPSNLFPKQLAAESSIPQKLPLSGMSPIHLSLPGKFIIPQDLSVMLLSHRASSLTPSDCASSFLDFPIAFCACFHYTACYIATVMGIPPTRLRVHSHLLPCCFSNTSCWQRTWRMWCDLEGHLKVKIKPRGLTRSK